MSDVTEYIKLKNRIEQLIEHFNFDLDPLHEPDEKQYDCIRAMIVLCHAEFEAYIENMAKKIIEIGRSRLDSEDVANRNISSLFLYSDKLINDEKRRPMSVHTYSIKLIEQFIKMIDHDNHGIKRKNIEKIFIPLGYDIDEVDVSFLNEIDAFGAERGKIAHTSSSRTNTILNKEDIIQKIRRILIDIKSFENYIFKEFTVNT